MKNVIVLLVTALFLAGCMSSSVVPQRMENVAQAAKAGSESSGKATIYVFRNNAFKGMAMPIVVSADKVSQGHLWTRSYLHFNVDAGTHDVAILWPWGTDFANIAAEATFDQNKTYYFLYDPDVYHSTLRQVDAAQAVELFKICTTAQK